MFKKFSVGLLIVLAVVALTTTLEALQTFHVDGTFTETSSELGLGAEGPAHGIWSKDGDHYNLTFYLFTFDTESGKNMGMVRVRAKIQLDSPDHWTAETAVDIIAPDGTVEANVGGGPTEAVRLTIEPV